MHLVLLSGGSGKRLWPLSNDIRSKQFLQLLPAGDGACESMLARVYRQLKEVGGWESITVVASAAQEDQLDLQLGKDVHIVTEPERRGTFPATALACAYLHDVLQAPETAAVMALPVDSFAETNYFKAIKSAEKALEQWPESLVLLGATPDHASDKYGYILPADPGAPVSGVSDFKEGLTSKSAQQLMAQGALWNCGALGFRLGSMFRLLRENHGLEDPTYESLAARFGELPQNTLDSEALRSLENVRVLRYKGTWKDLGNWETLTEEMVTPIIGRSLIDDSCDNTHIINELDMPVIGMGLKNVVVAVCHDGILVADKRKTPRLKDFVTGLRHRPMYEEKRWGSYVVLDHSAYLDGTEALTKKLYIGKGKQINYQYHQRRKELWTVISGRGLLHIEGETRTVAPGDMIRIDEGVRHGIRALERLEMIEVQLGSLLAEDDIVRLDDVEW